MSRATIALATAALFFSPMAHAYKDGLFRCKNPQANLPPVTFKIVSIDLPAAGGNVPFLEVTEYYTDRSQPTAPVVHEIHHKGIAVSSVDELGNETLTMANLHVELKNNELVHCTPL